MTQPSGGSSTIPPGSTVIPLNPDGTPNLGAIPVGGSSKVPVDDTGAINVWNLPQWILDYEKGTAKPFYWDDQTSTHKADRQRLSPDLKGTNVYKSVDQVNVSAEELMKQFAAMAYNDPQEFNQLQQVLAAGQWKSGMKVTGVFDTDTESALATAMAQYLKTAHGAGVPVKFKDYLLQSAASTQANDPTQGSTKNPGPLLTDPDTLRMYAQKAAQAALGRSLSESELNNFISQFHNEQVNSYTEAAKPGVQIVDKNDPRASAIKFVTQGHQDEFAQHQTQGYTDAFLNMFLNGTSSAPNMNVDPTAVGY